MRYRVHFDYSRCLEADSLDEAYEKAEWLRVGVGSYTHKRNEYDPKLNVEIIVVAEEPDYVPAGEVVKFEREPT